MRFLIAVLCLVVASPALAQTTGDLRGTVIDSEMGLPIPAVEVTLTSENLIGGKQERKTDANGEYRFTALPPGLYTVRAYKDGFGQGVSVTDIQVKISQVVKAPDIELRPGGGEEVEIVAKTKAVDTTSTTRGEVLTKEFLNRIPAGRSYQSAVGTVAGVTGGANPNMAGSSYNENTFMLDGANITDPVTGTFSVNFNYDAIQQIEVLLGGYEPEYASSLGGLINVVTQSGTNNLEFDTSVYYTNGDWSPKLDSRYTADGFNLGPTGFDQTFSTLQANAKVAGPIVRDKAWFILSYSMERSLIALSGIPQARDYEGHYMLGKFTVQPNAEHRLTAMLQLDPTTIDNIDQSDPFYKPEAQGRQTQGGYLTQGRWQWFVSPDVNIDSQIVVQKSFIESSAVPCTHNRDADRHPCEPDELENNQDWETPPRFGLFGAYNQGNYIVYQFDDRFRYQATSKLSILSVKDPFNGSHDFKFGVEGVQTIWDRILGVPSNGYYVDLNEVGFDPETFSSYYYYEYTGPLKYRSTGSQYSLFAQDAWKPISNLTIKYGSRYDYFVMRNDIGEPVATGSVLGPRLFAAWDPFNDQKTKIGGGYGRFNNGAALYVADFTSVSNFGDKIYYGEYVSQFGGRFAEMGFHNNQSTLVQYTPKTNLNSAHDKLRTPRQDEVLMVLEREVIQDVATGINASAAFTRFLYEADDTNLVYDEDGSQFMGTRYGDPNNQYQRLRTPALAKRDYYQSDFYVRKIESRRWAANLTYTYTQSIGSSTSNLSGSFLNDPQTQFNYGPMATDIRHSVKGWAYWDLPTDPYTQQLGAQFVYESGVPLERRYYSSLTGGYGLRIRPRGIYYRFNPYWTFNLQFRQIIDVRKGELILQATMTNLTNNQAPDSLSSAFYTEDRLFAVSRQSPRALQLGVQYRF